MGEAWSQKLEKMSDFDREQWCEFDKWRGKRNRVRQSAPVRCLANVIDKGKGTVREVPGVDAVTKIVHKSLQPLLNSVSQVGGRTVRRGAVIGAYRKCGHDVSRIEDVRALDLKQVLEVKPALDLMYMVTAFGEGAVTGVVTSGGSVAALAGSGVGGVGALPGAGTMAASLAGDVVFIIGASTRLVSHIAAYYGYDTSIPSEYMFAAAVLGGSLGAAAVGDEYGRQASLLAFNKLMQDLARKKTWDQLNKHAVTKVVERFYTTIGVRLTQRKLAQAVPVMGIFVGAGLNVLLINRVADVADHLYRYRFLMKKYGIIESGIEVMEAGLDVLEADLNAIIE